MPLLDTCKYLSYKAPKLCITEELVSVVVQGSAFFRYSKMIFPKLCGVNGNDGLMAEQPIKKNLACNKFMKTHWNRWFNVTRLFSRFSPAAPGFLRNHKALNSVGLAETLMKNRGQMNYGVSLKVHIHEAQLNKLKEYTWV